MPLTALAAHLDFLREIDRLKGVERRTRLVDRSRLENSAEHSWHAALAALVLAGHAPPGTDIAHVVRILLVHDLVEVDAGDTFAYDPAAQVDKAARERAAADRIFGLLPPALGAELRGWWEEFEAGATREAKMANALDRFAGLLQNWAGGDGGTWRHHRVTREAVMARMEPIRDGLPALWPTAVAIVEEAAAAGHLG
jgi:putative hydrolase of HD superfamily